MHDIYYDEIHDEFVVFNPFAQAILVFRGGTNGDEAPVRIIQGPHTLIGGQGRGNIDPVHDEIYSLTGDAISVFPRTANGDVAPIRVIRGPNTRFLKQRPAASLSDDPQSRFLNFALNGAQHLTIDPIHNLLIVGTASRTRDAGEGAMLIFNRTDSGDAKPRAVIEGPHTGLLSIIQMQTYPPKGWIITGPSGSLDEREPRQMFVGVWSIHDSGDVPPRWKITGPKSMLKRPLGLVLDPKHKEVLVGDLRLNTVLTFYFPEIF